MTNVSVLLRRAFKSEAEYHKQLEGKTRVELDKLSICLDAANGRVLLVGHNDTHYFEAELDNPGLKLMTKEFRWMREMTKPGRRTGDRGERIYLPGEGGRR